MSHAPSASGEHKPHVLPLRIYLGVWIGLLVLTVITVAVSYHNYGAMNIVVAMAVATVKATLVVLFFMHLKYDEHFNVAVFLGAVTFLGVFFILTLADTAERGRVDPIEAGEIAPVPGRPELMKLDPAYAGAALSDSTHTTPVDTTKAAAPPAGSEHR